MNFWVTCCSWSLIPFRIRKKLIEGRDNDEVRFAKGHVPSIHRSTVSFRKPCDLLSLNGSGVGVSSLSIRLYISWRGRTENPFAISSPTHANNVVSRCIFITSLFEKRVSPMVHIVSIAHVVLHYTTCRRLDSRACWHKMGFIS